MSVKKMYLVITFIFLFFLKFFWAFCRKKKKKTTLVLSLIICIWYHIFKEIIMVIVICNHQFNSLIYFWHFDYPLHKNCSACLWGRCIMCMFCPFAQPQKWIYSCFSFLKLLLLGKFTPAINLIACTQNFAKKAI